MYQLADVDPVEWAIAIPLAALLAAFMCAFLWLIYFLLTLPMRRNERARLFLDLLELGIQQGQTPETLIVSASSSRDRSLGVRFHLLGAHIASGASLAEGLTLVPRLLPPEVISMLKAGERMGDLRLVLPACRKLLRDAVSQVNAALNYLLLLTFVFTPAAFVIPLMIKYKVMPVYLQIFEGMLETPLPPFMRMVFAFIEGFVLVLIVLVGCMWLATIAYLGGPRLRQMLSKISSRGVDRFLYALPWRRTRLRRDFSHLMALLLDAGVPETEALTLAGEATGNGVMKDKAAAVAAALAKGVDLPAALEQVDDAEQVRWRLRNALFGGKGFARALAGWHENLEAKADQQEQAAAQLATTGMVLFNGCVVGATIIAMFMLLVQLINEAALW